MTGIQTCAHPISLGIIVLSLKVNFGEEQFIDKVTLSSEEFYEKLVASEEIPTTTLLNPQDFLDVYEQYPDEDLIVITLAKELSGTYQSANIAKDMTDRDNIHIIDSKMVTLSLGILVKAAAKFNAEGMPTLDIVSCITRPE